MCAAFASTHRVLLIRAAPCRRPGGRLRRHTGRQGRGAAADAQPHLQLCVRRRQGDGGGAELLSAAERGGAVVLGGGAAGPGTLGPYAIKMPISSFVARTSTDFIVYQRMSTPILCCWNSDIRHQWAWDRQAAKPRGSPQRSGRRPRPRRRRRAFSGGAAACTGRER